MFHHLFRSFLLSVLGLLLGGCLPLDAQLQSISFSPNPVLGGNNTTGTVCLTFSQHSAPLNVGINNYHPAASAPGFVTIPAFVQCGAFAVGTRDVTFTTDGQIGAYWIPNPTASVYATLTVRPKNVCLPPSISSQPQNQTINAGQDTTLGVVANGTGPVTFQWFQGDSGDTSHPVGTNSTTFTTPPLNNTTTYWVRVSNACGTANSNSATITVRPGCDPPSIISEPQDMTINGGDPATLSVLAAGTSLQYRWFQDGALVTGASFYFYNTPPLTADTTLYVAVSNSCGNVTSRTATVTVSSSCLSALGALGVGATAAQCTLACPVDDLPAVHPYFGSGGLGCSKELVDPTAEGYDPSLRVGVCKPYSGNPPPGMSGGEPCLMADSGPDSRGVSFQIWCGVFDNPTCDGCFAMYRQYQGLRRTVGKCWFDKGRNEIGLYYTSGHVNADAEGNIMPTCWLRSSWYNHQVFSNEDDPPLPDNAVKEWIPADGKLDTWLYDYSVDQNKLGIAVKKDSEEVYHRDPPPGPGFNDIPPIIPNKIRGSEAMTGTNLLCDVSGDGKCDAADGAAVHAAVGSCRGSALFDPRFDVNGDGCITAEDEYILFPVPGDLNGDQKVDCTDLAIVKASFGKKAGQPGFDFRADANRDAIVDIRDLAFVAQKLPASMRCQ